MKKTLLPLLTVLLTITIFSACTKDNTTPPVVALTRSQVLVKYNWQVDEIWRNIAGVNSHYVRNGVNTTGTNYTQMRLMFNADSTGTYIDEGGTSHATTWKFTSADQHNMQLNVGAPSATTFTWNLVEISDSTFTSVTPVGTNTLVTARYVPIGIK